MPRNAATNRFIQRNANAAILANGANGAAGNILSIANNASLNPTAAVTVDIWHRPRSLKAAILFDNSTGGVTNSYFVGIGADLSLLWYSTIGGLAKNITTTTSKLKLNEWNFITATYDGANIYLFANGAQFGTLAATGSLGTNSGSLFIGAYSTGSAGLTVDGALYNPRIYSAGCTLAEHQDRYYNGITSTALQAALELDLDTNRGAGTTVLDLSGNGNTATLGAGASWSGDVPFKSRKASVNANMVKNGDFEYAPPFTAAGTTSGTWIDGTAAGSATNNLFSWAYFSRTGTGTIQFDSAVTHSGLGALKVSTTATASLIQASIYPSSSAANVIAYGIPVSKNTSYRYSFWVKTIANSGSATTGANVSFQERTAANGNPATTSVATVNTTVDWQQFTGIITTSSTTDYMQIVPRVTGNDGSGTLIMDAWFDDISLTPVYPEGRVPVNGNLVKNFNFEVAPTFVAATSGDLRWIDGTAAGSATNSTYKWGTNNNAGGANGVASFDGSVSHSGNYSLKISTLAAGEFMEVSSYANLTSLSEQNTYAIPVSPNTAYTCTYWMKTNYVSGDATTGARFDIIEYDRTSTTALISRTGTAVKTTTDWTQYTISFTTTATTQLLRPRMLVYGHQGAATLIMDAWFDDIYLAPTTNPGRVVIT